MGDPYRVVRKRITRSGGEVFGVGDVFEPTKAELESFGDRLQRTEIESERSDSHSLKEERETYLRLEDVPDDRCDAIQEDDTICGRLLPCHYHFKE